MSDESKQEKHTTADPAVVAKPETATPKSPYTEKRCIPCVCGREAFTELLTELDVPYETCFQTYADMFSTWRSSYKPKNELKLAEK